MVSPERSMQQVTQLFADDLVVGFAFGGEETILTSEHFSGFAQLTGDKHPIHYDATYAARTTFGRPVAHGLLLTALTALGATSLSARIEDAMIALVEQQMRFLRPVFIGDVVTPRFEVVSNKPASGHRAVVGFAVKILNQNSEAILEGRHVYLLRRRPET
jgi:3-hydroxybutyryl-CoA dehydratase